MRDYICILTIQFRQNCHIASFFQEIFGLIKIHYLCLSKLHFSLTVSLPRLKWFLWMIILDRMKIQLQNSDLLLMQRRSQTQFQKHTRQERFAISLTIWHRDRPLSLLCMYFLSMSNIIMLLFVRKRFLFQLPQPIIIFLAIAIFISISMTIGILTVCFTASQQSGMFFWHFILICSRQDISYWRIRYNSMHYSDDLHWSIVEKNMSTNGKQELCQTYESHRVISTKLIYSDIHSTRAIYEKSFRFSFNGIEM